MSHRPAASSAAPAPPLGTRLASEAPELDPDRAAAILDLEVLRHVVDRHLGVVPHPPHVLETLSHVGEPFIRLGGGEPFLELTERALHQLLRFLGRVNAE